MVKELSLACTCLNCSFDFINIFNLHIMINKLFSNFWLTFGLMLLVAVADLIALPTEIEFGLGFVLTFGYFVWWIIRKMTGK